MDPPTSFKIPILLRKRGISQRLNNRVSDRLNSSLAFKKTAESFNTSRNQHEITSRLTMTLNPGFRMETTLARSEMKREYPNYFRSSSTRNDEVTPDKSFFRKKDEMVNYIEHYFKNQIVLFRK